MLHHLQLCSLVPTELWSSTTLHLCIHEPAGTPPTIAVNESSNRIFLAVINALLQRSKSLFIPIGIWMRAFRLSRSVQLSADVLAAFNTQSRSATSSFLSLQHLQALLNLSTPPSTSTSATKSIPINALAQLMSALPQLAGAGSASSTSSARTKRATQPASSSNPITPASSAPVSQQIRDAHEHACTLDIHHRLLAVCLVLAPLLTPEHSEHLQLLSISVDPSPDSSQPVIIEKLLKLLLGPLAANEPPQAAASGSTLSGLLLPYRRVIVSRIDKLTTAPAIEAKCLLSLVEHSLLVLDSHTQLIAASPVDTESLTSIPLALTAASKRLLMHSLPPLFSNPALLTRYTFDPVLADFITQCIIASSHCALFHTLPTHQSSVWLSLPSVTALAHSTELIPTWLFITSAAVSTWHRLDFHLSAPVDAHHTVAIELLNRPPSTLAQLFVSLSSFALLNGHITTTEFVGFQHALEHVPLVIEQCVPIAEGKSETKDKSPPAPYSRLVNGIERWTLQVIEAIHAPLNEIPPDRSVTRSLSHTVYLTSLRLQHSSRLITS